MSAKSITTMTDVQFNKLIGEITKRVQLLDKDIQTAAVFAVYQSIEHRNATPANTLFQAVSNTKGVVRRDALAMFLEQHGNLAYSKVDKKIVFFDVKDMTGVDISFDETKLMTTPWHSAVKEPDITSAWDVKDQLDKLLTKLERAIKNNERPVENVELVAKVRAVMAAAVV